MALQRWYEAEVERWHLIIDKPVDQLKIKKRNQMVVQHSAGSVRVRFYYREEKLFFFFQKKECKTPYCVHTHISAWTV